jgi:nucleotide-binding universal stress UspA family protein
MKALKTVFVGVDFSEASKAALIEADYISMWEGGDLHVAHVIAFNEAEELVKMASPTEEVFSSVRIRLKAFSEEASNLCATKQYHVGIGHPFYEMMDLMDKVGADLLVIGSHGSGSKSNHVGGVASKCIRHAKVPVLVVREKHKHGYKKVVVCMDFSKSAKVALKYGAEIAGNEGAELLILNVQTDPWGVYNFPIMGTNEARVQEYLENTRSAAEKKLKTMKDEIRNVYPGAKVSSYVKSATSVSQGIMDFINDVGADLAVVGTQGHSRLAKFFIGTTTERLVHRCPCSVLTVGPSEMD